MVSRRGAQATCGRTRTSRSTTLSVPPSSGVIQAFGGGQIVICPFDEAMSLGHSIEAQQIARDTARILMYEANAMQVPDPFAGSYAVESKTDEVEAEIWKVIEDVDAIGGAVEAIETGFYRQRISASAWQTQREIEDGTRKWVGVNSFTEPDDLPLTLPRHFEYDRDTMASAGQRQVAALKQLRAERESREVVRCLSRLREVASNPDENVLPSHDRVRRGLRDLGRDVRGAHRGVR